MTEIDIRFLNGADLTALPDLVERAFGGSVHADDHDVELGLVDAGRLYGAFDADRLVATAGSYALDMTVPGGSMDVAGVTLVAVEATYRRRGILRALMTRQLEDLKASGEAVAALWASESAIYQRYGYGPACWSARVTVPTRAPFRNSFDEVALARAVPSAALLAPLHDAVMRRTAGWHARDEAWWRYRLHDPEYRRSGFSPLEAVIAHDGYALYATKPEWGPTGAAGMVQVREIVAASGATEAALWRYLLDLDLMATVTAGPIGSDSALLHRMADPRKAQPALRDNLWVRIIDVPAALSARSYATGIDVVLDVADPVCPANAGRWRLTGGPTGAECCPTGDVPQLRVGVADLAAAFLGGTTLGARAGAGDVVELVPGHLAAASTAFGWPGPAPFCPMVF